VWEGKQIVPRDWVEVARTPTLASKGEYGALFWLNAKNPDTGALSTSNELPEDAFYARGFGGQLIAIIPSRDAVIVMMNAAYTDDGRPIIALLADILKALPHASETAQHAP
jgi:CubicO group peptidase (beta-lactamase class C family)